MGIPHDTDGDAKGSDWKPGYCTECNRYLPGDELTLGLCEECQPTPFEDEGEQQE